MAEAYLRRFGGTAFEAESAGLEPGVLNLLAVRAMALDGIDISRNATKSVFDLHARGKDYDLVVQVCDAASGKACPTFPGTKRILHWDLEDPGSFTGSVEERLEKTMVIRDRIRFLVEELVRRAGDPSEEGIPEIGTPDGARFRIRK